MDPTRVREMYALYETGATLKEVGERYGITRERVRQVFDEASLRTRSSAQAKRLKRQATSQTLSLYIDKHRRNITQTFRDGRNMAAIAEEHDLPILTIRRILKQALPAHEYRAITHKPSRKQYTDDELVRFLREASAAREGILTIASYEDYTSARRNTKGRRHPTPETHKNRFGSWQKALHAAGLQANTPHAWGGHTFDVDECLAAVRTVAQKLGKPPTGKEYEQCARESKGSLPSLATVRKRCGRWLEVVGRAEGDRPGPASTLPPANPIC